MTPEGKIKAKIKRVLAEHKVYYFMPVQHGFGAAGLDFHCVVRCGRAALAFFVEAKAPGKKLTPRQEALIERLRKEIGARVFVVDDEDTLAALERELFHLEMVSANLEQQNERPPTRRTNL